MSRVMRAAVVLLILSLCAPFSGLAVAQDADIPEGIPAGAVAGEVTSAPDGRTLSVLLDGSKRTIILLGVDAPLLDVGDFGECYATEAQRQLKKLAPAGQTVYLESDPDVNKDDEGRLVRYVWTIRNGEPIHLNFRMVRDGFADYDDDAVGDASPYTEDFQKAVESAKDNDRGLWEECGSAHKKASPPPTPTAVPTSTPTAEERLAEYVPLADVRELAIRPASLFGQKFLIYGRVFTIQVAGPGNVFVVGDSEPHGYEAILQIWVLAPDGTEEPIVIGYDGDTAGMFEGTYVAVYGTPVDTFSGTNAFGGSITQPLVEAELVVIQ